MYNNILIIDDSETSRMIIRKCFLIAGLDQAKFQEAEDGIKALTVLGDNQFDLIVTDLNMPRMDGLTLVKKLQMSEKTKKIPVLVISSMGNEAIEEELKKLNVKGILRKPMTPAKLTDVLQGVV